MAFARERSPALPLILADIRQLPMRRESVHGIRAAASLIRLPKATLRTVLADLLDLIHPGGALAATFTYGLKSRRVNRGWIPGRYFAGWTKDELDQAFRSTGWDVMGLKVVTGRERKGRWINVIARRGR